MTDSSSGRPFAVFDIDGTIIRWQLYHAVVDRLGHAGHLKPEHYDAIREARMTWKRRTSTSSFRDYEHTVVKAYDEAVLGLSREDYLAAVQSVFDEYKEQTYAYTRDLIRSLQAQGYLLFAISASQREAVELLARYYGFDDWGGTIYESVDGRFTGNKQVLKRDRKPEYLKELVAKHGATWQGSIAVGDSDSDIPMLETVEHPIVFNPNQEFFKHAQERDWKVVLERKNVVYELEQGDGSVYTLAQTNCD